MLYVIIGIILILALIFMRKKNEPEIFAEQEYIEQASDDEPVAELAEHVAPPITSPGVSASAMYSSAGDVVLPQSSIKKDAYGLHWCNRNGSLNMTDFVMKGPMVYWSDGAPSVPEPSCIDITLPFEFPTTDSVTQENPSSYAEMSPIMRGRYLLWISGGRTMVPDNILLPAIWFMGVERRVLIDKQDISSCIFEIFRMLPIIRDPALYQRMGQFAVWACVRALLPEEQIFHLSIGGKIPNELLCFVLSHYSNAKLPLPSHIAFKLMTGSPLAKNEKNLPYTDEIFALFSSIYKGRTNGGLVLVTPKAKISLGYSAVKDTIDIPDFFSDIAQFAPLINSWSEFITKLETPEPEPERSDWAEFVFNRLDGAPPPLIVPLKEIAELMSIDTDYKATAKDRKEMSEMARVEGFLLIPNLCVSGKEYSWDDPVGFAPIAMGEKISDTYNAAAITLEFACAILGGWDDEIFEKTISKFSLSEEETARLGVNAKILQDWTPDPDNIGGCIAARLKESDRAAVRNFFVQLFGKKLAEKLNYALDVQSEVVADEISSERVTEIFAKL